MSKQMTEMLKGTLEGGLVDVEKVPSEKGQWREYKARTRQLPASYRTAEGDGQERIRASLNQVVERNPNIKISAKVPSIHGAILRKDFRAIAEAVREVAALNRGGR